MVSLPEVERPLTIGIVGAHSTGKSAFLARLAHDLRRHHLAVATVSDLGEQAQRMGMPILQNHTWASTLWIITRGISNELEAWLHADVVLVDRAVPDALGYYYAALEYRREPADPRHTARLETLVRAYSSHYDLLFRTSVDPRENSKPDNSDERFRVLAAHHVERVVDRLGLPCTALPGHGHDAALAQALDFVTTRLNESEGEHHEYPNRRVDP